MSVLTTAITVAAGMIFGLAIAAPPGPMNAIIAEESVLRGWTAGFRAGLGAMTADACFLVLASIGAVAFVERAPLVRGVALGVGGLLMLWFAYSAVQDVRGRSDGARPGTDGSEDEGSGDDNGGDGDSDGGNGFRKAFVLALTNPYQIVFWLTIGVSLLDPGRLDVLAAVPLIGAELTGLVVVSTGSPTLLVGFFAGIGCWIVGYPTTLVAVGKQVDGFDTAVAYVSAAVLCGFGVLFLADGFATLA